MDNPKSVNIILGLNASILGTNVNLFGELDTDNKIKELRGSAKIDKSLNSFLHYLKLSGHSSEIEQSEFENIVPLDIKLARLTFSYQNVEPKFLHIVASFSIDKTAFDFFLSKELVKDKKESGFLLGLISNTHISLSKLLPAKLPLLEGFLEAIAINQLRVLYANQDLKKLDLPVKIDSIVETIDRVKLLTSPQSAAPIPEVSKGFSIAAVIGFGEYQEDFSLQITGGKTAKPDDGEVKYSSSTGKLQGKNDHSSSEKPDSVGESQGDKSSPIRKWFPVNKTFGPLHIGRIGGEWRGNKLGFLLDTAVDLFGLTVGLNGFRLSLQLFEFIKKPALKYFEIGLDGLDISFSSGPVAISAGLLKTGEGEATQFTGMALIKAKAFTISGMGSFTMIDGKPSLFIFALLDKDLGGPTFFHVTGLAAGFGINRRLRIPEIEQVSDFPLIKAAMDINYFKAGVDAGNKGKADDSKPGKEIIGMQASALEKLQDWLSPARGEYWLAAGVRFTSFEMIESFALLSVAFGTETVISILGMSKITIPKPLANEQKSGSKPIAYAENKQETDSKPIAYAELVLRVVFKPQSGVLMAEARLTENSYIFSKDCKLTGGFAFYAWFAGEHAGDFVVTLGGYHPRFIPPKHYPVVPRLGINWQVSSHLKVSGEIYFALTPTCIMAGGKLSAVYQVGRLRAWFIAYADFLIVWKPLYYDIAIGISIGVSYRFSIFEISKTLKIELGAQVHMWGPPFEGKARISLWIISFTIYFGAGRQISAPPPLAWDEFQHSFLPRENPEKKEAEPITIMIADGIIKEVKESEHNGYTIVNPHQLVVIVKSAVPSTKIEIEGIKDKKEDYYGTNGEDGRSEPKLGIRPMGRTSFTSMKNIKISNTGNEIAALQSKEMRQNVPDALWSPDPFDPRKDEPKAKLIRDVLCGVELSSQPSERQTKKELEIPELYEQLPISPKKYDWKYSEARTSPAYQKPDVITHIKEKNETRSQILQNLTESGIFEPLVTFDEEKIDDSFTNMVFQAIPVECGLGMLLQ